MEDQGGSRRIQEDQGGQKIYKQAKIKKEK